MRVGGCRACTVQRARYLRRRGLRHVGFSTTRAATGGCVRVGVAVVLMSVRSFLPTQPVNDPPERVPKDDAEVVCEIGGGECGGVSVHPA
jgi:hypothetical protein